MRNKTSIKFLYDYNKEKKSGVTLMIVGVNGEMLRV